MRSAVVRSFQEPLVIEERSIPEPGSGQVVIQVEASGLCHTDIHAAHGDWPVAAIDVTGEKLQLAQDLGADLVIDARAEDPAAVLRAHGGATVAIGLAVDDKSFATAYAGRHRGGRLVLLP